MQYIYICYNPTPHYRFHLYFFFTRCCFTSESDSTHVANEDRKCKKKNLTGHVHPNHCHTKTSRQNQSSSGRSPHESQWQQPAALHMPARDGIDIQNHQLTLHMHIPGRLYGKIGFCIAGEALQVAFQISPCLRCINRPSSSLQHPSRPSPSSATTKQSKPVRSLRA